MTLDGSYTATVDRIEEGLAVLLVEADGETVAERHLDEGDLPAGAGEGAVLELAFEDGDLVDLEYRPDETEDRRDRVRGKFDRLSKRLGDADSGDVEDGDKEDGVGNDGDEDGS